MCLKTRLFVNGLRHHKLLFIGAILTAAVLIAGCRPKIVEIEVTRVVTQEREPAEEVETETEAVVVTRVTVEEEYATEALEEAAPLAPEAAGAPDGGIGAIGTEEDGGSPFDPGSRQKVVQRRDAGGGWIDLSALPVNDQTLRLVASEEEQTVIVFQKRAPGRRATLVVTQVGTFFTLERAGLPPLPTLSEGTSAPFWAQLAQLPEENQLAELSTQLNCDQCDRGGVEELLIIRREGRMITLFLDEDERVDSLDAVLSALRLRMAALAPPQTGTTLRQAEATCCRLGR